jgi:mycothiol synthase
VEERQPTLADAPVIAALLAACDTAVLGRPDYGVTDVEADLRRDDLQHVGWYDGQGRLVAYGWVGSVAESSTVQADAYVHPEADGALGPRLLAALEARGLAIAAAAGHDHALFDVGVYRQDGRTRAWMRERGFTIGTTFTRMRIDLAGPVAVPDPPAGVAVLRSGAGEDDLRTAHAILEESFAEHYGHVPRTFAAWRARYDQHAPRLWLASLDGRPVGGLVGTDQFAEDENAGYVRTLGVLREARGRGVATALLHTYFAAAAGQGRAAVILHVDVANATGALGLYESVGMRPVLQIDAWAKRTPVEPGPS